ncbi:hypothetical protein NZD89_03235 [Alicyclobacillus fastidiosus]|uniref:Uncharacterized protein n=1 Tax=Alicyclobacillus fastidiosus TaxID=392011 RepID=A0ABY6ZHX3_9BACL|nr:hypothetical protein [Alicyclobacillus fastidiosus]WAH42518.1 hypothetical protein NZD89_03235 [Alicyclobacillus fastidiosus]GMA64359.1 hypothetical protein GCM10025859_47990 [Alicyclobacillus fastidiosus]
MPRISVGELHVDHIDHTSGSFYGQNLSCNWRHSQSVNEGFGAVTGERNTVHCDLLVIGDQDILDTFMNDSGQENK